MSPLLAPQQVWVPMTPERPQIHVWTPRGWVPLESPTFPVGTDIRITTPITNNSSHAFNVRARVGIFEGSVLPGRGDNIRWVESSWSRLGVGQTLNFPVTHTTVYRAGVERRDVNVEVRYLDNGVIRSGGDMEWDDLFWVDEVIEFVIGNPTVTAV